MPIEWTPQRRQIHRMATERGVLRGSVNNALAARRMSNPYADEIEASIHQHVQGYRRQRHEWLEGVWECSLGIPPATYIEHFEECLTILAPVVGRDAFDPEKAAEAREQLAHLNELDLLQAPVLLEFDDDDGDGCGLTLADAAAAVADLTQLDPDERAEAIQEDLCDDCARAMLYAAVGLVAKLSHDLYEALGGSDVDD